MVVGQCGSGRHEKMLAMFGLRQAQALGGFWPFPELVEGGMEMIWLLRQAQDIVSTGSGTDLRSHVGWADEGSPTFQVPSLKLFVDNIIESLEIVEPRKVPDIRSRGVSLMVMRASKTQGLYDTLENDF